LTEDGIAQMKNVDSFELFNTVIWRISKGIQKLKNREMAKFGLKGAHVMCLFYLRRNEEGLTAAELSELCDLDKGAVSRTLTELEAKDYVSCPERKDGEGRRGYRAKVFLTDRGRQRMEAAIKGIEETVDRVGRGLSEAEKAVMYRALSRISANLKREN